MCGCLSCTSYWGPAPQPRNVPWLGIKAVTLCFKGQCSIHWDTPARAPWCFLYSLNSKKCKYQIKGRCQWVSYITWRELNNFRTTPSWDEVKAELGILAQFHFSFLVQSITTPLGITFLWGAIKAGGWGAGGKGRYIFPIFSLSGDGFRCFFPQLSPSSTFFPHWLNNNATVNQRETGQQYPILETWDTT